MKNRNFAVTLLFLLNMFLSCGEPKSDEKPLPPFVAEALKEYNYSTGRVNNADSTILHSSVLELSIDSCINVIAASDVCNEMYEKANESLKKVLVSNPEYSKHSSYLARGNRFFESSDSLLQLYFKKRDSLSRKSRGIDY
jgi:hypothetical protein